MTTQILITLSGSHNCLLDSSLSRGSCCTTAVLNSPLNGITIPLAQHCPIALYLIMKVLCIWQWLDGDGGNCVWLTESLRLLWSQSSSETGKHHLLFWLSLGEELVATKILSKSELCSRPFCDNENILYLVLSDTDIMTLLSYWPHEIQLVWLKN